MFILIRCDLINVLDVQLDGSKLHRIINSQVVRQEINEFKNSHNLLQMLNLTRR